MLNLKTKNIICKQTNWFLFTTKANMVRLSKRRTYLKKLETRVNKLRKAYLTSLNDDSELFETNNYLHLMYIVSYHKLQVLSSK